MQDYSQTQSYTGFTNHERFIQFMRMNLHRCAQLTVITDTSNRSSDSFPPVPFNLIIVRRLWTLVVVLVSAQITGDLLNESNYHSRSPVSIGNVLRVSTSTLLVSVQCSLSTLFYHSLSVATVLVRRSLSLRFELAEENK